MSGGLSRLKTAMGRTSRLLRRSLARTRRLLRRSLARARQLLTPGAKLGLALSPRRAVAVEGGRGLRRRRPRRIRSRDLAAGPGEDGWPELVRALGELCEDLGREEGEVELHLALLPPLGRAKCLRLPPVGRGKLGTLVRQEAGRHFLGVPEQPVTDVAPVSGRRPGAPSRCLAVCADRAHVETVLAAVREAGFRPGLVVAGAPAVAEAATTLEPGLRRGDVRLRVEAAEWAEEVELAGGRIRSVRPLPPAGDGPAASAEGTRRLGEAADTPGGLGPRALAALGALLVPEDGPSLLVGEDRGRWRSRLRRRAGALATAAAALLAAAAGLHLWGVERDLHAVARERAALADRVRQTAAARDAALELRELVAALHRLQPQGPAWSEVFASLATALPRSAYLEAFRTREEGIRLSGVARSPPALVPRLEEAPFLKGVTPPTAGRSTGEGQTFELGFSVGPRASPARVSSPSAATATLHSGSAGAGAAAADSDLARAGDAP